MAGPGAVDRAPSGTRLRLTVDGSSVVGAPATRPRPSAEAVALGVFIVCLVGAWVALVFQIGADRWFLRDDWWFLAGRDGGSPSDLLAPHADHLTALPILAYRVLFTVFGVRFTPFLVLLVTMHLGVVALLRVVMRRAGVGPWLATAAAVPLALFGPGRENILWAFQITFVGALLFGLVQLLLADHDGPLDRRDWLGLLAGGCAVLCSGVGPLMVGVVGLSSLVRRGWRAAAFHTVPLGAAYLLWYTVEDPPSYARRPPPGVAVEWARRGLAEAFEALGHGTPVGLALAAVLVVGLALWFVEWPVQELRRRFAPVALLVAVPVFFVLTAQARWFFGSAFAGSSRYVYLAAALTLPALGLASQAIASRWRPATGFLALVLLAGVPGNMTEFDEGFLVPQHAENQRQTILGLAHADGVEDVPGWVRPVPDRLNSPDLTVGWLLQTRAQGRLPAPGPIDPRIDAQFPLRLGLVHAQEPHWGPADCAIETAAVDLDLVAGDVFRVATPLGVALRGADGPESAPLVYHPSDGNGTLVVVAPELSVTLTPPPGAASFEWCRVAAGADVAG